MKTRIEGNQGFSYLKIELDSHESIITESDAMSSMDSDIELRAQFNGGFFKGLLRKYLGGETLFISRFSNPNPEPRQLTLVQPTPGEIRLIELDNSGFCLQPGAYLASAGDVKFGLKWAGIRSFISGEGLFKIFVFGTGQVWYGAYGALLEREVDDEYIVDTAHLVAYEPQMKIKLQLAGGIFSSFFGGEGLVTRIEGKGKIIVQTRSLSGLASWLNPKLFG